ncbi:TonB-dependent receptor plug domain-containing protein [Flaviramulus sp. BrNp1-15]|uniref:TonB-dependent receptor plug domain-containing protein n=1 Tax=Flaviramulus sp. BrNp1-15 TaxID=2916754 RepID=UPI001EE80A1A|nr:TonB-dependent receptor plug domain-containing protein [Flaviramulus sp. BrNp1-15]ULC58509.1 TonB-dependent receptor plug domain-containing protein [Flaviramulus sp. BrNp1-15]
MKRITSYLLIFICFCFSVINAQKNSKVIIKGTAIDSIGRPVVNASILVDDIENNSKTNRKGLFKLKLDYKPEKLKFISSVYGYKELEYNGEKDLNVIFVSDSANIDLISIMNRKKVKNIKSQMVYNTVYDYFRARVSGVQVSGDNRVVIRGITSFNSSTDPLFIVNGSPVSNIIDIDPNQIKSVTIIKDSKAAEYGVRGANGVILITLIK